MYVNNMSLSPFDDDKQNPIDIQFENTNYYDVDDDYYCLMALKHFNMKPTGVSKEYFSVRNIKRLQKALKKEILERSYGKFILDEDQKVMDLLQVMMYIYSEYGRNLPTHIIRQVKKLNYETIQYTAPDIMDNLKQYYGFLKDITNPINPLPDPINVNHSGRVSLPSAAQLFGL
jgi:hypothetical protein